MRKVLVGLISFVFAASILAATYDKTANAVIVSPGNVRVVTYTHDFSTLSLTNGEVVKAITVPAKSLVQAVSLEVVTVGAADNTTAAVGDSSSSTGWVGATALTSTGITVSAPTVTATGPQSTNLTVSVSPTYGLGKAYSAANDVRLTAGAGTITNGKVRVRAVLVDLSK